MHDMKKISPLDILDKEDPIFPDEIPDEEYFGVDQDPTFSPVLRGLMHETMA